MNTYYITLQVNSNSYRWSYVDNDVKYQVFWVEAPSAKLAKKDVMADWAGRGVIVDCKLAWAGTFTGR